MKEFEFLIFSAQVTLAYSFALFLMLGLVILLKPKKKKIKVIAAVEV